MDHTSIHLEICRNGYKWCPHLHQIHCVLRVPLKKVRWEISVGGAGLPVTTGIPTNQRESFLTQRLQLRSKIGPTASCGRGLRVRDLGLRARPCRWPYLPRAPGSSRTPCFPSPARSKCRSTPFTRWRPQELQGDTMSAEATVNLWHSFHFREIFSRVKRSTSYWDKTLTCLRNWAFQQSLTRSSALRNPTEAESSSFRFSEFLYIHISAPASAENPPRLH